MTTEAGTLAAQNISKPPTMTIKKAKAILDLRSGKYPIYMEMLKSVLSNKKIYDDALLEKIWLRKHDNFTRAEVLAAAECCVKAGEEKWLCGQIKDHIREATLMAARRGNALSPCWYVLDYVIEMLQILLPLYATQCNVTLHELQNRLQALQKGNLKYCDWLWALIPCLNTIAATGKAPDEKAREGGGVASPPGEAMLTTWKSICEVFNAKSEHPLTIKQLKYANENQSGPINVQKGQGKRPSVAVSALLDWRAKLITQLPLLAADDGERHG